jgi:hypothetical protein
VAVVLWGCRPRRLAVPGCLLSWCESRATLCRLTWLCLPCLPCLPASR